MKNTAVDIDGKSLLIAKKWWGSYSMQTNAGHSPTSCLDLCALATKPTDGFH